jgi:cyclase
MGLAVRIIPTLLKRGTHLVKGRQFSADRVVGHVLQAARIYQARGVDELVIMDIGTKDRGPDFEAIRQLTDSCFMPLTVGGGVTTVDEMRELLRCGADKVAWNEALLRCPGAVKRAAVEFGSQACVASMDYSQNRESRWQYVTDYARYVQDLGVGEIFLTGRDREGTMEGYDLGMIERISMSVDIPVIAHGGCSGPEDMLAAIEAGASAVAAGALFQFTEWTPKGCAQWLHEHGVEVRL